MLIRADARTLPFSDSCVDCVVTSPPYFGLRDYGHARQIGLEQTPDAYVASLVAVFADVRRVLKDSGTVWVNLGSSYVGSCVSGGTDPSLSLFREHAPGRVSRDRDGHTEGTDGSGTAWSNYTSKLKKKDLLPIPWMVAMALQADGWYLRSDIIWSKPNKMPEAVTDRPTMSHEYLFLLTKRARYRYDAAVIAEPVSAAMLQEIEQGYDGLGLKDYAAAGVQNPSDVKARIIRGATLKADRHHPMVSQGPMSHHLREARERNGYEAPFGLTRNKRTVWTVNTQPYSGAHFATMPEKLVEPCVLAGCPIGGLVLDPFIGSGTVGAVAERLGRRWVGVDLNYQQLAQKRTAQRGLRYT